MSFCKNELDLTPGGILSWGILVGGRYCLGGIDWGDIVQRDIGGGGGGGIGLEEYWRGILSCYHWPHIFMWIIHL